MWISAGHAVMEPLQSHSDGKNVSGTGRSARGGGCVPYEASWRKGCDHNHLATEQSSSAMSSILGSRGLTGFKRLMLGAPRMPSRRLRLCPYSSVKRFFTDLRATSVAEKVQCMARCPMVH